MRHNQNNGRRFRGRNNSGGGGQSYNNHGNHSGGGNHSSSQSHGSGGGGRRNPRVQTFDSNGSDVRIRGNAYQINEKYLTLAKDAASAGDRVLAESYLQHAEHYQRLINEMTEEYNKFNPPLPQHQPGGNEEHQPHQQQGVDGTGEQPAGNLADLDQGFLVGPRHGEPQTESTKRVPVPTKENETA